MLLLVVREAQTHVGKMDDGDDELCIGSVIDAQATLNNL